MYDVPEYKRKFSTLNIIYDYNKEALAVEAQFSFTFEMVNSVLNHSIKEKKSQYELEWKMVLNLLPRY